MLEMQDTINNLQRELAAISTQAADLTKLPGVRFLYIQPQVCV
jgi:hypothetical protein